MPRSRTFAAATAAGLLAIILACAPPKITPSSPPSAPSARQADRSGDDAGTGGAGGSAADTGSARALPDAETEALPAPDTCTAARYAAAQVPLDLYLLIDVSGSMSHPVFFETKWALVRAALARFFADPKSAGLGVGLQLFPVAPACRDDAECSILPAPSGYHCRPRTVCLGAAATGDLRPCTPDSACPAGTTCTELHRCSKSAKPCTTLGAACDGDPRDRCENEPRRCRAELATGCAPALYDTLALPVGELPAWTAPLSLALGAVVPGGSTPMAPALTASLPAIAAQAAARPGRKPVLVLASDGLPSGCEGTADGNTLAASAAALAQAGLPSYVIGVFRPDELEVSTPALARLATAGGTGAPFVIEEAQDLTERLVATLAEIRGRALACDFALPAGPRPLDPRMVDLRFTSGAGAREELAYVGTPDRCDPARGGWHYDDAGVPTRIVACPASCQRFAADAQGAVEIAVGCRRRVE